MNKFLKSGLRKTFILVFITFILMLIECLKEKEYIVAVLFFYYSVLVFPRQERILKEKTLSEKNKIFLFIIYFIIDALYLSLNNFVAVILCFITMLLVYIFMILGRKYGWIGISKIKRKK